MTIEHAEMTLRKYFPNANQDLLDDMETYLVGKDDPEDYFNKVATDKELLLDFEDFMASGSGTADYPTPQECESALEACKQESLKPIPHVVLMIAQPMGGNDSDAGWIEDGRKWCWNIVEEPIFKSEHDAQVFAEKEVGPAWMVVPVSDLHLHYIENRLTGDRVLKMEDAYHEFYQAQPDNSQREEPIVNLMTVWPDKASDGCDCTLPELVELIHEYVLSVRKEFPSYTRITLKLEAKEDK